MKSRACLQALLRWVLVVIVALLAAKPTLASDPSNLTSLAPAPNGGYWVQQYDAYGAGKTVALGGAPGYENVADNGFIVAVAETNGYWVVNPRGKIYSRGGAPELCNGDLTTCSGFKPGNGSKTLSAVAATPDGKGFWAVGADGAVWTAGTAQSYGDIKAENRIPTGIVGTPSGKGYYIVIEDGSVYVYGDAKFYGSTGGQRPNGRNATGLALSYNASGGVNGYWMVGGDGTVITFGDAPFLGSTGGNNGGSQITQIAADPLGNSYAWVHANAAIEQSARLIPTFVFAVDSGLAWDAPAGQDPAGSHITMQNPNESLLNQRWLMWKPLKDVDAFQFYNLQTGLCADASATPQGTIMIQWACQPPETWGNQMFFYERDSGGRIALRKQNRPGASLLPLPARAVGGDVVLRDASSPYYVWNLLAHIPQAVIASQVTGQAIDETAVNQTEQLMVDPVTHSASQIWKLQPASANGSIVQLINGSSGLCIELPGDEPEGSLGLANCDQSDPEHKQLWNVLVQSSGGVELAPLDYPAYRVVLDARHSTVELAKQSHREKHNAVANWVLMATEASSGTGIK